MKVGAFNRRNVGRIVLLTWAGSLAWLARREFGKNEAQVLAEATIRLSPEAHFFFVRAAGRQVGYASVTVDTVPAGFRLSEVMALDVPEADSTRRVTRRTDLVLSRSLRLREFSRTVSGGGLFEEVSGMLVDSLMRIRQRDSRDRPPIEWAFPVSGDVVLPQALPYRLAYSKRLQVGRSVTANVLDLATGVVAPVTFTATAESTFIIADSAIERRTEHRWVPVSYDTVKAFRIEHQANGTPVVAWVDEHGGMVGSEAALGVRLERSAFELVSFNYREDLARQGPGQLGQVPAMRSLIEAGEKPDTSSSTTYSITSSPIERFLLPRLDWLAGGRQATANGELHIGGTRPASSAPRVEYLDPEREPLSIDPTIRTAAGIIVGTDTDPERQIQRLVSWVAKSIAIDTARGSPLLAPTVLKTKRAGAEGHAALFVSLARATGIRARSVGGVALLHRRVYGHAWSEVWLDGSWMAVDPTFGQIPASSQLLRVNVGGSSRAIDLVPVFGSAKLLPTSGPTDR